MRRPGEDFDDDDFKGQSSKLGKKFSQDLRDFIELIVQDHYDYNKKVKKYIRLNFLPVVWDERTPIFSSIIFCDPRNKIPYWLAEIKKI